MQWRVRAYNEWRLQRLSNVVNFDVNIFEVNLDDISKLDKNAFIHALCNFIPEVTKVKDGSDYPGKTLYEMVTSIQKYLSQNNVFWKLIDDPEFREVRTVLDNVMKECAQRNIGTTKKQAKYIDFKVENDLWETGVLGESSPDQLRDTVLFLLGLNLGLRAGDEHYNLRRFSENQPSQITFERASNGQRCLVYREDSFTKNNDGGLNSLGKERKLIWVYPSENVNHCPIRIVDKYMSLLPPVSPKSKKLNLYLHSLEHPNPAHWYGEQVVGRHTLTKVVSRMLKDLKPGDFYTNHSLHRSGTKKIITSRGW